MSMIRQPQVRAAFDVDDPLASYYNDLSGVAREYGSPQAARDWCALLVHRREQLVPVTVLQLALGAWQLRGEDPHWLDVVGDVCDWLSKDFDECGRIAYLQSMPHTFRLDAPWHSAMAQGQAVSLLVRAARDLHRPELLAWATCAARSLIDPQLGLIAQTPQGPVLQEYPTERPSHVLNGWIWGLWGLHDLAHAENDPQAREAFEAGVSCLVARLPQYEVAGGWTRYDLYPHPIAHVASPFYHRLHIEQLVALQMLTGNTRLLGHIERWRRALGRRSTYAVAVGRKVGFRLLRPRRTA